MSNSSLIYLLDTNVCIVYLKNKGSAINRRFDSIEADKIAVCSVVKAELFYGSNRSNNPQKRLNIHKYTTVVFISICIFIF
ncbi:MULTISPECIES: PIN domain-containing protein [Sphaerospermopsis]|uniref:Virulence-associated protein VapC n=1 Tax=Sphaerospermopsis reniformis TaxID=531300 RepID=A0A479ZVA0_9CYAN|nr:PIN domain-containing protein [Sphaerospermopsis reniformis]BAZ83657.1 virulence-associated protein VapC [Sphaerospermopsis kisseleviana NIES-73]GCL35121.1 virulence-associated protein VapC [Sphaerospermopsis reniformis]